MPPVRGNSDTASSGLCVGSRVLVALLLTAGCVNGGREGDDGLPPGPASGQRAPDTVSHANIVWHELGRNASPPHFRLALASDDPELRWAAARALGRIQDPESPPLLIRAARRERDPTVLREIAFALGQIHSASAFKTLATLARHGDAGVRTRAIEAVGKLEGDLPADMETLLPGALTDADARVRGAAALALWRRDVRSAVLQLAGRLEAGEDDEVRWRAAYALMRLEDESTLPHLRARLQDVHPWVRTFAAWGLRNPPDPEGVEPIARMLSDPGCPWTARVQGFNTLRTLREEQVGDQDRIRQVLITRTGFEQHPQVTRALIEALAEGGGESERRALERMVSKPSSATAQRAALVALARIAGHQVMPTLREHLRHHDAWTRAAAARALGYCGPDAVTSLSARLDAGSEPDVRVRAAAVAGLGRIATVESWRPVREVALGDSDTAVRGTAIEQLAAGKPAGWQDALVEVYAESGGHEYVELRQTILKALKDEPALAQLLEQARKDPAAGVRFTALQLSEEEFGVTRASFQTPYALLDPRAGATNPRLTLETSRGDVVLELFLADAPRHVSNIVHLARKGFYDGLGFHRVVPSFVVQGGDPRGDGWGDAGYAMPDEINGQPYLRGTLGMPKVSKDDGGCQVFITHLPTPHLDGRYTVFGQVVDGLDVIDRIEVGDVIRRAVVSGLSE